MKEIWNYKYFIISSIKTDFMTRFSRSKLGFLWLIINPLMQVLMYALVLSYALKAKLPGIDNQFAYAIYLISGMMAWALFNDVIMALLFTFTNNANIIKKLAFPKMCLPLIAAGSSVLTNIILIFISIVIFIFLDANIGSALIFIPLLAMLIFLLAFSIGLLCGTINVFLRDMGQLVGILMQFGFWFTPIVYMPNVIPPQFVHLLYLNPLACIVEGYHKVILYNQVPDFSLLIYPLLLSLVLLCFASFVYKRASGDMADAL